MKIFHLTVIMTVSLMIYSNGIPEQPTQPTLNQVESMKQFIGSWTSADAKDTTKFYDFKPYGTGLEIDHKCVVKGNILLRAKILWGYNERVDKYIIFYLPEAVDMQISAIWFVSDSKFVMIKYSDISNPKKAAHQMEGEFKSSDSLVFNWLSDGKTVNSENYIKVK